MQYHQRAAAPALALRPPSTRENRTAMHGSEDEDATAIDELQSRLQAQIGDTMRIVEVLRAHGAEYVVHARDLVRGEDVFLRLLAADRAAAPDAYRSFERTAELAARLDHPNIMSVGPLMHHEGLAYYAVHDVRARTLDSVLAEPAPPPLERTLAVLRDVASALDYVHGQGVVHGQLEPSLILLRENGSAAVSDFGAGSGSPVSHSGRSPAYMAPEQWQQNTSIDGRADVYALGVIAFEMITGRRRAISVSGQGIAIVDSLPITHDVPLRPGVGLHVNEALLRAISKRPTARFPTAGEFVTMLEGTALIPVQGLPTERPALGLDRSRHVALLPMAIVAILGTMLGVIAAPSARQALRRSVGFPSWFDGLGFHSSDSPASGYSASSGSSSTAPAAGSSSGGGNSLSSQSIFPGAATAAGGGGTGSATAPSAAPSSSAQGGGGGTASSPGRASGSAGASDVVPPPSVPPSTADSTGFVQVDLGGATAIVVLDGIARGSTPYVGQVHAGAHTVSLIALEAFTPANRHVVVTPGDTTIASFSKSASAPQ